MIVKEVTLIRVFDAPRELVYKAWTDPLHLARWWGPKNFTNPVCEVDLRPGGALHIDMQAPDGTVLPVLGVYLEVVIPERLVFTTRSFEDANGETMLEGLNTVTFEAEGSKTKVTVHAVITKATPELDYALAGMETGWGQSLDKLALALQSWT